MEITNEKDSMLVLSNWLTHFNVQVWWNQKNEYYPVFKSEGTKRSDLIIKHKNKHCLIECKHASHNKNVYDAFFQILNYAKQDIQYHIDNKVIQIDGYVVATENSINGHLFKHTSEVKLSYNDFGDGKKVGIENGEIPVTEYSVSEAFCRLLWRGIIEYDLKKPVGILLSNKLNDNNSINPLLLLKKHTKQYMVVIS